MSVRHLAKDLYEATKRVEELERCLLRETLEDDERQRLERELREARDDRDRLREMLNRAKA